MLPCAVQGQSPTCHCDRHKRQTFIERLRRCLAKVPRLLAGYQETSTKAWPEPCQSQDDARILRFRYFELSDRKLEDAGIGPCRRWRSSHSLSANSEVEVLTVATIQTSSDEVKTVSRCCGDEGKKMEASAESNRVAGVTWRREWSAEANCAASWPVLALCSLHRSRTSERASCFLQAVGDCRRHGRNSDDGESDRPGTAILRGSMWQRQIDIDML
jgi:hypothetical protein